MAEFLRKSTIKVTVQIVLLVLFMLCADAAEVCSEIKTREIVGLENGLVRIEFSKISGQMISLKNLVVGDEYIKRSEGDGNPFRAYVDTTEMPKTVTQGAPWPVQPVEDAMGGELVDPVVRVKQREVQAEVAKGGDQQQDRHRKGHDAEQFL